VEVGRRVPSSASGLFDIAHDGVVLRVHVQPGSGGDRIVGVHGEALKVRVSAPAVSGRANAALLALLARELGVGGTSLRISAGAAGRRKRVVIDGLSPADLEARLRVLLDRS
jgi:uncharacterized protein